jgi:Cu+-exporting ATPase
MTNATTVKDPVCGMDVDVATAPAHSDYQGQTHYFCGTGCKEKFDLNPEQYLGKSPETSKGGCCS